MIVSELVKNRRSYQQFCGLARALDQVGERWTLLVVRELLLGPRRYTDLLSALPGLTTNLLASRLRELERLGLITRRVLPPPLAVKLYELTESGRALEATLMELARWGSRYMREHKKKDRFNVAWALLSLKRRYVGGMSARVELRIDARTFELGLEPGYLSVSEGSAALPDLVVTGTLDAVRSWLFAGQDAHSLRGSGALEVEGDDSVFAALARAFAHEIPAEEASRTPRLGHRPAPEANAD